MVAQSTGVFGHFNLDTNDECELLATALYLYLRNEKDSARYKNGIKVLSDAQFRTLERIAVQMNQSPLMRTIIDEYMHSVHETYSSDPERFLTITKEIAQFAVEEAAEPAMTEAYEKAVTAWNTGTPINGTNHAVTGSAKYRPSSPNSEGSLEDEVQNSSPGITSSENKSTRLDSASSAGENASKKKLKKPSGVRLLGEGLDFSPARLGVVEPWKFRVAIPAMIPDPKNPGRELPYPAFVYKYDQEKADDFDWNDEIEVGKLTAWRSQIRYRNFPPTRKERAFWLEIELAKITHMMKKQLESSNTIKWNRLANEFNEDNRGRIQRRGEAILKPGRKRFGVLHEDRPAAWRSARAIQTAVKKNGPTKKLAEEARDASAAAMEPSSDSDEDEDNMENNGESYLYEQRSETTMEANRKDRASIVSTTKILKNKRKRSADNSDSSDDEENLDPNPQPSKSISKPKRLFRSKGLKDEQQLKSSDDEEYHDRNQSQDKSAKRAKSKILGPPKPTSGLILKLNIKSRGNATSSKSTGADLS